MGRDLLGRILGENCWSPRFKIVRGPLLSDPTIISAFRNSTLTFILFSVTPLRTCLRDPIPEIFDAARYLDAAVTAHLRGDPGLAGQLIRAADIPEIRDWTESLWGANSPYVKKREVPNSPLHLPKRDRIEARMPNAEERRQLHERDGFHCRFCGIPVIRKEIRVRIARAYPEALPWGRRNSEQHAAFQAMWLQYDHIQPHARGGDNSPDNLAVTCAPCNFGKADFLLDELSLTDPRDRTPVRTAWDGLERVTR
jgi:hypothetical protein